MGVGGGAGAPARAVRIQFQHLDRWYFFDHGHPVVHSGTSSRNWYPGRSFDKLSNAIDCATSMVVEWPLRIVDDSNNVRWQPDVWLTVDTHFDIPPGRVALPGGYCYEPGI